MLGLKLNHVSKRGHSNVLHLSENKTSHGMIFQHSELEPAILLAKSSTFYWSDIYKSLTHCDCGLVMPYGNMDLGKHWIRFTAWCLIAPSHYLNQCWPLIESLVRFCGIHLRANSQVLKFWFSSMILRIILLSFNALRPRQNGRHFTNDG